MSATKERLNAAYSAAFEGLINKGNHVNELFGQLVDRAQTLGMKRLIGAVAKEYVDHQALCKKYLVSVSQTIDSICNANNAFMSAHGEHLRKMLKEVDAGCDVFERNLFVIKLQKQLPEMSAKRDAFLDFADVPPKLAYVMLEDAVDALLTRNRGRFDLKELVKAVGSDIGGLVNPWMSTTVYLLNGLKSQYNYHLAEMGSAVGELERLFVFSEVISSNKRLLEDGFQSVRDDAKEIEDFINTDLPQLLRGAVG